MPAAFGAENQPHLPSIPAAPDSSWQLCRRWLAARIATGARSWFGRRFDAAFGILTYHRVARPVGGLPPPTCNVTPAQFRRQLTSLLEQGYEPWPLSRALNHHRQGRPIPRTTFVVTFDDGYANFHSQAWPVLRELQIPATLFLVTAYLDSEGCFPFDTWKAAGSPSAPPDTWQPLTSVQCAEMLDDGLVEIGSHTHTHRVFRDHVAEFCEDLRRSQEVLDRCLGVPDASFSFPFGICSPELMQAARTAGVSCALTTQRELVTPHCDPFGWGRFGVTQSDTGHTLAAKLDGWYSTARALWQSLRFQQTPRPRGAALQAAVPHCDRAAPADQRVS